METLIRLSSTLSSQIKELGVKVTARDGRTKGANGTGRVDPAQSFSACVLNTAVDGEVFFEPTDSLHDFIQQIEDSIIYLLLEKVSLTELPSVSNFFVSQVAKFHDIDLTACIYANSPLATIRSSIRIIASNDIGRIMEHLESIFLGVSSLIEKKITLLPESFLRGLNFPSSVSELSRKQLFFALQVNDPFAQVLHCRLSASSLSSPSLSSCSAISKTKSTVLSIRVENAGSEQVHGLYNLSTSLSKVNSHGVTLQNPVYNNSDGYMISCQQKEVCLSVENVLSRSDISKDKDESAEPVMQPLDSCCHLESDSTITSYRWVISNPSLDCKYYTCSTMEPSPLPPAVGWKSYENSCQGKLPGPHLVLIMVDDESQDDSDSGKSETDNDNKQSEITDATNTATLSAKEAATKLKTRNKNTRKKTATALVSTSFPPCVATMADNCKNSAESETSVTQSRQISNRHRRTSQKRLFAPEEDLAEAVLMSTCCTGTDRVEAKVDSICKDQQLCVFSEALEKMKVSHCHRAEKSKEILDMHMKRLNAAQVVHSSKLQEMTERQAWLTAVTDTDELLEGFPYARVEVDNDDIHSNSMVGFSAEWDLRSAVSRANAACLLTKSACPSVSKALIDNTVQDAAATIEPVSVTVTVPIIAVEPMGAVRKVASLPTFKEEDMKHDKGHRRSLSQSQSQSQSHSIFQWPEGAMPPPSVNFLIENDQYRQLPIRPDGSSPHRSASQLQWSPSVTESSTTSNGAVLSALESSEIPVTIDSLPSNKGDSDSRSGEGDGEWDGEGEGSSACFESLLNAISPAEQQCLSYSIVDVIGIQMRVPQNNSNGSVATVGASLTANGAGASGVSERAHYVIRISLRDSGLPRTIKAVQTTVRTHSNSGSISGSRIRIPLSPPSITIDRDSPGGSADGNDCNDGIIVEPSNVSKSCHASLPIVKESILEQQGQSNTRRHSMAGLRPTYLFSRQVCTIRKDLTALFLFHAQLCDLISSFKDNTFVPPPFPDPFLIATFEEGLLVCSAQQVGSFSRQIRPPKKTDLFAYSSSKMSQNLRVKEAMECPGLDRTLRDIQQYLRSVFALVESIDSRAFRSTDDQNLSCNRFACDSSVDKDLLSSLGKLIGALLTSPDQEDKNPTRTTHAITADLLSSTASSSTSSSSQRMLRKSSDAAIPAPSTLEKVNFKSKYKACWRPYLSSGLKIRLSLSDDQGGRLSMKSDDELLRAQGGKCVGCGEPISAQWGFLGVDRNYQPCRLYGGLFCRKWCHGNDRRQIPHRLLLHWDHRAHRVSKQAARFLDMLWSQPVLMISSANPLLYEGVPALRLARNMRGRVLELIRRVLKSDTCPEKSDVRDVIMAVLGAEKAHLCLSKELCSISDLVGVQNGDLLASLEALIGMLRDMDRTLGVA